MTYYVSSGTLNHAQLNLVKLNDIKESHLHWIKRKI